jgi:hypothetical protein
VEEVEEAEEAEEAEAEEAEAEEAEEVEINPPPRGCRRRWTGATCCASQNPGQTQTGAPGAGPGWSGSREARLAWRSGPSPAPGTSSAPRRLALRTQQSVDGRNV